MAAAAALALFTTADQNATDARAKAVEARDAKRTVPCARGRIPAEADTQATAAEAAADAAWTARGMAWTAVAAADAAAMSAMGATTSADTEMYQKAAGRREGHRGSAGYGRGHVLYGRHGCGSSCGDGRWHARPRIVHVG